MRRYPEWATYVGDNRYGDKLFDATREGEAADYARARRELAAAKAIARDRLAPTDQVSLDIFIYELEQQLRMERFVGFRRLSLGSQGGFQSWLSELLRASPTATRRDAEQILARLAAYPRRARPGDRVPARRHRARLGAAAHGARPRPRAARSAARARRPTAARSSSPSAASAATSRRRNGPPCRRARGAASPTTCCRPCAGCAPSSPTSTCPRRRPTARSRATPTAPPSTPSGSARRRRPISRRRRSTRSACARSSGCGARWTRCVAKSASRATSPPSFAT